MMGFGHSHTSMIRKNFSSTTAGSLSGYFWHTNATRIAQLMPPSKPSTLLYNPLHLAHFLIALKATLNTDWSGTKSSRYSATLAPFRLRTDESSIISKGSGSFSRSSGANRRSTSVVFILNFNTGVYASRTGITLPSPTSSRFSRRFANRSKKAVRVQCLGATSTRSISASGVWTSNLTDPNVLSSHLGLESWSLPCRSHSSRHQCWHSAATSSIREALLLE